MGQAQQNDTTNQQLGNYTSATKLLKGEPVTFQYSISNQSNFLAESQESVEQPKLLNPLPDSDNDIAGGVSGLPGATQSQQQ